MRVYIVNDRGDLIEKYFDPYNNQPTTLFNEPIKLISLFIEQNPNDKTSHIVTLYTKTFRINIDRRINIRRNNDKANEHIDIGKTQIQLNLLRDTEFIKGTIELKEIDYSTNKIIHGQFDIDDNQSNKNTGPVPFKNDSLDNLTQVENDEPIDTIQSYVQPITLLIDDKSSSDETVPFNNPALDNLEQIDTIQSYVQPITSLIDDKSSSDETVPFNNAALDNLEQIKNEKPIDTIQSDVKPITLPIETSSDESVPTHNHCSDILTQCEQKITNEKQDLVNAQNFYTDMIMKYRGVIKQKDTEFQQTTTELKQQSLRCAKELKKQINLNNENNKKINDSQSTQTTTIIIICVLIIIVLLGLCIYLYFF